MPWLLTLAFACTPNADKSTPVDDTQVSTDDSGLTDAPSMRWLSLSGECVNGGLRFTDVPPGPHAIFFTTEVEGAWYFNPGGGMGSELNEESGTLTVPCGTGNDIGVGRGVRISLGYPAADLPSGEDLKFRVLSGECGTAALTLAEDADMAFASLAFTYTGEDGLIRLNPPFGMSSAVQDGEVVVDCGTDGNTVRAGSTVHATLSYTDAGDSLDWLSFQGECGPDSLGFAAEPGPVVVSLQNTYAGTSTWTVNTGSAMGALVSEDGVAQVPCGTGNDIPYGGSVRVALGYAR